MCRFLLADFHSCTFNILHLDEYLLSFYASCMYTLRSNLTKINVSSSPKHFFRHDNESLGCFLKMCKNGQKCLKYPEIQQNFLRILLPDVTASEKHLWALIKVQKMKFLTFISV